MIKKTIFLTIIFLFFLGCTNFVLAAIDSVNIQMSVDNCNNNGICEPLLGETYSGCPLDLCEPPSVVATTTINSNVTYSSGGGSIIPLQESFFSNLQYLFSNFLHFKIFVKIKNVDNDSFYAEWNKQNANSYFRLVKSRLNYPKDAYDGQVVFEGNGHSVGPEYFDGLYYYGLFELGLSGFISRAYFTTPDKIFNNQVFDRDNVYTSSKDFPDKSFSILEKKIEISQNKKIIPIINNEVNLDADSSFSIKIEDSESRPSNYLVTLHSIFYGNTFVYNLNNSNGFIFADIKNFGLKGGYILRIKRFVIPRKTPEIKDILINFIKKNKNNLNLCDVFASVNYFVCYESFGPSFHIKNFWDI